jgi:hypothetical protein
MPKHTPAPGRRPVKPYLLARHIRDNGSHYDRDYFGVPVRTFLAVFVAVLFLVFVAGFGTHVAPVDPPQAVPVAAVVSADTVVPTACFR